MVNSTRSPSRSCSKTVPSTELLWKKTSCVSPSGRMKPKPRSSRTLLMVPCAMVRSSLRLHSAGMSHDPGHKEAARVAFRPGRTGGCSKAARLYAGKYSTDGLGRSTVAVQRRLHLESFVDLDRAGDAGRAEGADMGTTLGRPAPTSAQSS